MRFNTSERRFSQPKSFFIAERDRLIDQEMYNLADHFDEMAFLSPADINFKPSVPLKEI